MSDYRGGMIAEIQFHLKALLIAREEGVSGFHIERGESDLTAAERRDVDAVEAARLEAAFRESLGS